MWSNRKCFTRIIERQTACEAHIGRPATSIVGEEDEVPVVYREYIKTVQPVCARADSLVLNRKVIEEFRDRRQR